MSEGNNLGYFQFIELENILKKSFKKDIELINYKYLNPIIKYKADKEIIYV
jgi:predicted nucleotidyltransferase